jgi:hypothetical protein
VTGWTSTPRCGYVCRFFKVCITLPKTDDAPAFSLWCRHPVLLYHTHRSLYDTRSRSPIYVVSDTHTVSLAWSFCSTIKGAGQNCAVVSTGDKAYLYRIRGPRRFGDRSSRSCSNAQSPSFFTHARCPGPHEQPANDNDNYPLPARRRRDLDQRISHPDISAWP